MGGLYEGQGATPLPLATHVSRFAAAGFRLDTHGLRRGGQYTWVSLTQGPPRFTLLDNYTPPSDQPVPALCDHCGKATTMADPAECACGQHFCSVECHAAEWDGHRDICDTVADNNMIALQMTTFYWRLRVEDAEELLYRERFTPTQFLLAWARDTLEAVPRGRPGACAADVVRRVLALCEPYAA